MKRYRRMMSIGSLTDTMIEQNKSESFREAVLLGVPGTVLGSEIARRIDHVELVEHTLVVHVPDEAWRKEISKRKPNLLRKAREILSSIKRVDVIP